MGSSELLFGGLFIHAGSFYQLSGCPRSRQRTEAGTTGSCNGKEWGFSPAVQCNQPEILKKNRWRLVMTSSFCLWVQGSWKASQECHHIGSDLKAILLRSQRLCPPPTAPLMRFHFASYPPPQLPSQLLRQGIPSLASLGETSRLWWG